jgi:flavin reductase (DIM6/NTAB) family NADH-FMN oxidoreductase RutF
MDIQPAAIAHRDLYHILISAVAPRPIAWISTLGKNGQPNLAPFSFFTVVSAAPPMLGFSPAPRRVDKDPAAHETKDTLRNIRDAGEFVVNVVTFDQAESMNITSGDYVHSVNEFERAKLNLRASQVVGAPQVAESPVSFECKLVNIMDFGGPPATGHFVIGEIVSVHLDEGVLREGKLDRDALDLVGRMGGHQYSRTNQRFEMIRPKAE